MLKTYDVHDYGAVGDGKSKDTAAIQSAIDTCSASGGGRVLVAPGIYLSATLWLKSRVELHLSHGAEILGSPDLADYNADDAFTQNMGSYVPEVVTGAHLIICLECHDVAITGGGRINGNSSAFFDVTKKDDGYRCWVIKDKRPGQMVFFCECSNVRVENISFLDSPYWNLFMHGCENVMIRGLYIYNDFATRNGDGIDIDCCKNVVVDQCNIHSGDDALTVRADPKRLVHKRTGDAVLTHNILAQFWPSAEESTKTCENIVVSNCILSAACNAIHVGVGDGVIKNCRFNNIVIHNSRWGINLVSRYQASETGDYLTDDGCKIDGIVFSNITMDNCVPFMITTGAARGEKIRNVFFDNICASGTQTSYIEGSPNSPIRNLRFNHLHMRMSGGEINIINPQDSHLETWDRNMRSPSAFYIRHVDGLHFHGSAIEWIEFAAPWKFDVMGGDVRMECDELKSNGENHGIKRFSWDINATETGR